jgi:hypothetical protein
MEGGKITMSLKLPKLGEINYYIHSDTATIWYSKIGVGRTTRSHTSRTAFVVIGVITSIIILAGFVVSGIMMSNDDKRGTATTLSESLDMGEVEGKVISHNGQSAIGATVVAYKSTGFSTSLEKDGGYTAKSSVSIGNTFNLDLPSGVYDLIVFYHDGTHDVIKKYAVWPNTSRTIDFNY